MSLQWKDVYKLDHFVLDAQHQQLFVRVSKFLLSKDRAEMTVVGAALSEYTRFHLSYEECLMKRYQYPDCDEHLDEHGSLISLLDGVMGDLGYFSQHRDDMAAFMKSWVLAHISTSDKRLAAHIAFCLEYDAPNESDVTTCAAAWDSDAKTPPVSLLTLAKT